MLSIRRQGGHLACKRCCFGNRQRFLFGNVFRT